MTFKTEQSFAPQNPKEYRDVAICLRPSLGLKVASKAVHKAPNRFPTTEAAMVALSDRPNSGPSIPSGTTPT